MAGNRATIRCVRLAETHLTLVICRVLSQPVTLHYLHCRMWRRSDLCQMFPVTFGERERPSAHTRLSDRIKVHACAHDHRPPLQLLPICQPPPTAQSIEMLPIGARTHFKEVRASQFNVTDRTVPSPNRIITQNRNKYVNFCSLYAVQHH